MTNNGRIDESLMHPGIPTGVQGFDLLLNSFSGGTAEVKNLLLYECDVVTECRVCRNLFRSLPSFIAHKRSYCKDSAFEQSFPRPNSAQAKITNCSPHQTCSDPDDAHENFENVCEKNSTEKVANETGNETESGRESCKNATTLSFDFLNRLAKRVESTTNISNAIYGPLHRYPGNGRIVRQSKFENGVRSITNNVDSDQITTKEKRNQDDSISLVISQDSTHSQHGKDLRIRTNDSLAAAKEMDAEEWKNYESLSPSEQSEANDTFVANSKNHRQSLFSSNLREKRALKSPYDSSEFISSLPKRSKRSPNDPSPSPIKKRPTNRGRPAPKRLSATANFRRCSFGNSTSSSNFDKFPVIFTAKQKQESSAMMDVTHRKCKLCGASFTNKCNMERHCYMHLGYVRFKCSKCEVAAFFRTELRRHLRGLCKNLPRSECGSLTDDELNDLIHPVCPEEPGKIVVWKSKTTWGNNFKGRENIEEKSESGKDLVDEKINEPSDDKKTNHEEKKTNQSNVTDESVQEKKLKQSVKISKISGKTNGFIEEKKPSKSSSKFPSVEEKKQKNGSPSTKKEIVSEKKSTKSVPISITSGMPTITKIVSSQALVKPIVKMFKGSDGKVWAQPFFPKN